MSTKPTNLRALFSGARTPKSSRASQHRPCWSTSEGFGIAWLQQTSHRSAGSRLHQLSPFVSIESACVPGDARGGLQWGPAVGCWQPHWPGPMDFGAQHSGPRILAKSPALVPGFPTLPDVPANPHWNGLRGAVPDAWGARAAPRWPILASPPGPGGGMDHCGLFLPSFELGALFALPFPPQQVRGGGVGLGWLRLPGGVPSPPPPGRLVGHLARLHVDVQIPPLGCSV